MGGGAHKYLIYKSIYTYINIFPEGGPKLGWIDEGGGFKIATTK